MIHVRFDGRSYDMDARKLDIESRMPDSDIKLHLARHFDTSLQCWDAYIVDRRPNGDLIVRPEAVYG